MTTSINLLPKDVGAKTKYVKIGQVIKKAVIAGSALYIVVGAAAAVYIFLISEQISEIELGQEALKANIESMSATEQSYILIKDRIQKASTVLLERKLEQNLDKMSGVVDGLPDNVKLSEVNIGSEKTEYRFLAANSLALSRLLAFITADDAYDLVFMDSFSFSSSRGYLVGITTN